MYALAKFLTLALALTLVLTLIQGVAPLPGQAGDFDRTNKEYTALMNRSDLKSATFAGGCFWCLESDFEKIDGVEEVVSGYTGGQVQDPTYGQVCSGRTGHLEAVQVFYDPAKVDYAFLLDWFWRHVDPTDPGGSFVDRGGQYAPAIFHHDAEQKRLAEESKARLEALGVFDKPIATEIRPLEPFYPAEDYHQGYHQANAAQYGVYRCRSGRDDFLDQVWGQRKDAICPIISSQYAKPGDAELRQQLTLLQYAVTQEEATERPFDNEFWDHKGQGIYVDILSGEPLFSSTDKFDSGTGWPSFTRALEPDNLVLRQDDRLLATRTEVRSRLGDNHLGHVFDDGPQPTGERWCLNSAALRFVPREQMAAEGYDRYLYLFE